MKMPWGRFSKPNQTTELLPRHVRSNPRLALLGQLGPPKPTVVFGHQGLSVVSLFSETVLTYPALVQHEATDVKLTCKSGGALPLKRA